MDGLAVEARNSRTRAHRAVAQRARIAVLSVGCIDVGLPFGVCSPYFSPRPDLELHDRPDRCLEHEARRVAEPVVPRPRIELVDRPAEMILGRMY